MRRKHPAFRYPPHLLPVYFMTIRETYVIECRICSRTTGHKSQDRKVRAAFLRLHRRCALTRYGKRCIGFAA
jgi:hypothetical protein